MISTKFDTFQARQNEPIVRQGQRKRRRCKHYRALAKQDTSKRPPWIANPTGTATRTRSLPKHCACAAKRHVELEKLRFLDRAKENSTCRSIKNTLPRRIPMAHASRLTANGCGRLRTAANSGATPREHGLHPQTPTYKREPFATHSGKMYVTCQYKSKYIFSNETIRYVKF